MHSQQRYWAPASALAAAAGSFSHVSDTPAFKSSADQGAADVEI